MESGHGIGPTLALILLAAFAVGGCSRGVVRTTGHNVIETDAGDLYADAFHRVVSRMQHPELHDADPTNNRAGEGRKTDFEARNEHWDDGQGTYAQRGSSTFTDAEGVRYTVQSTSVRGRPTVYVFESADMGKARTFRDAVARETRAMLKERE